MVEITRLIGHAKFKQELFERSPKTRWQSRSEKASLYSIGIRAAEILQDLLPMGRGRFGLETPVQLSPRRSVQIKHLLAAAMYSPMRYLNGVKEWTRQKHLDFTHAAGSQGEIVDLLERAHQYRSDLGHLMELQQKHDGKTRILHPERFGGLPLASEPDASGDHALVSSVRNYQEEKTELESFKTKIAAYRTPIKLLGAAIDLANFEHILNSPEEEERRRYARRVYYHAKLLDARGQPKEAARLSDRAFELLNNPRYTEISTVRNALADHLSDIREDLKQYLMAGQPPRQVKWIADEESDRLLSDVKSVSRIDAKLNEPPDDNGKSGWSKYEGQVNNVHDTVRLKLIRPGADVRPIRDTAARLKGLVGQPLGNFHVQDVEVRDYLDGHGPRNYKALHVIFHVASPERLRRIKAAGKRGETVKDHPHELKKFECQITNDALEKHNKDPSRMHALLMDLKEWELPAIEHDVPAEHFQEPVSVHVVDPQGERHVIPVSPDHLMAHVLDRLMKKKPESGVTPGRVAGGYTQIFSQFVTRNKVRPLGLHEKIVPGMTYYVHHYGQKGLLYQKRSKEELKTVKRIAAEDEWRQAMLEELAIIQQRHEDQKALIKRDPKQKDTRRPAGVDAELEKEGPRPPPVETGRMKKQRKRIEKKRRK